MSEAQATYEDEYPACERTYAELRIYSSTVDPEDTTRRLGLPPTSTQTAGEVHVNSLGRSHTIVKNGWFLSSEPTVASKDLRRHLDWLIDRLWPSREELRALQRDPQMALAVRCVWWASVEGGGPTLGPAQMGRLAELNLECEFELAFYGE